MMVRTDLELWFLNSEHCWYFRLWISLRLPVYTYPWRKLSIEDSHQTRIVETESVECWMEIHRYPQKTHTALVLKKSKCQKFINKAKIQSKCSGPEIKAGPGIQSALQETDREQEARKRISVMFLIIIIIYVVSYLTSLTTQVYNFVTTEHMSGYRWNINMFCLRLNLLNHIANPYIYWFYDVKFRKELQKLCCKRH